MILDCESFDSTMLSICEIFNIPSKKVFEILWDKKYDNPNYDKPLEDMILDDFTSIYGHIPFYNEAYWFHLTRSMCIKGFKKGIYPLGEIKDELFEALYSLVKDVIPLDEWNKIIKYGISGHHSNLYRMKISDPMHHGPYALLIKEVSLVDSSCDHNYLKIPEIIEDIAIDISKKYEIDLNKLFFNNSLPAIIRFRADIKPSLQKCYLKSALLYMYFKIRNIELSNRQLRASYDGENTMVHPDKIAKIEIIREYL